MKRVLQERGLWIEGLKKQCGRQKQDKKERRMHMRHALQAIVRWERGVVHGGFWKLNRTLPPRSLFWNYYSGGRPRGCLLSKVPLRAKLYWVLRGSPEEAYPRIVRLCGSTWLRYHYVSLRQRARGWLRLNPTSTWVTEYHLVRLFMTLRSAIALSYSILHIASSYLLYFFEHEVRCHFNCLLCQEDGRLFVFHLFESYADRIRGMTDGFSQRVML